MNKMVVEVSSPSTVRPSTMILLSIPSQSELMEAVGHLAMAHTHLELMMRYTVKALAGLSVREALDATNEDSMSELRKRIRKLFIEKKPTNEEISKLDALLGAAQRLSEKRNNFLHSAWSESEEGQAVLKNEDHEWVQAPSKDDINKAAQEIMKLVADIKDARSEGGFILGVVESYKQDSNE